MTDPEQAHDGALLRDEFTIVPRWQDFAALKVNIVQVP